MAEQPLRVGDVIHGHVEGYFGRDHYHCARVEAIGADWVVVRDFDGGVGFGHSRDAVAAAERARTADAYSYGHSPGCTDVQ